MNKTKKGLISVLLILVMLSALLVVFAGCEDEVDTPPENSVVFKVCSSAGDEWLFDLEDKRLYGEYKYTGEEIEIFVSEFRCPYSTNKSIDLTKWRKNYNPFAYTGQRDLFSIYCLYWDADEVQHTEYRNIKDVGRYVYTIESEPTHCDFQLGFRAAWLEITVTE